MSQESFPILNPVVYLNYLDQSAGSDYEVTRDVSLATLGALAWDILSSIPEDRRLIRTGRVSTVLFAYFLARPSALALVVLDVMLKTGPINDCTVIAMALMALQAISTAASSYLFLQRVHAVYYANNIVKHFFSFMWLVSVGASCAVFPGTLHDYTKIADTKHCLRYQNQTELIITYSVPVAFDALVYSAISFKILTDHRGGKKWNWRDFWKGKMVPHFSQAILHGGQQYYGVTNWINITRLSQGSQGNLSPTFQMLYASPAAALTSAMASRVYRNLIIESFHDSEGTGGKPLTAPKFADRRAVNETLPTNTTTLVSPGPDGQGAHGISNGGV